MIKVDEREKIRRAYFIEHKSQRQIAKELGHSRDLVKKAIESTLPGNRTQQQPRGAPILGPYLARIEELLDGNERLPRKQRHTGHKIPEEIVRLGYAGSESGVRRYIGASHGLRPANNGLPSCRRKGRTVTGFRSSCGC